MKVNTLIVDDNEHDRYILKRWLKTCSFEAVISEATDGQNAMEYFAAQGGEHPDGYPPSIIFLDINMPRVDGFEFLEQFAKIRAEGGLDSAVIVMFTSSPLQSDKDRAFASDFVRDFLVKEEFTTADIEKIVTEHHEVRAA